MTLQALQALMIDSREPENIQRNIQQFDFGAPVVVVELECGDLWASCTDDELLVIERKTPSDLLASIGDKRLFLQAQKMHERSKWAYIVVTGWLTPTHDNKTFVNNRLTGWNWDSVQGALLSVQEMGVNIVYCADDHHYPKVVQWLARRERKTKVLPPTEHMVRVMSPGERLLTSLPGIGLERAQALLKHRTPAHALAYLTWVEKEYQEIDRIEGIGAGIKAKVRQALGLADGETLELYGYPRPTITTYTTGVTTNDDNDTGSTAATQPVHLGDHHGSSAGNERQQAFWREHGSASRGDYGKRL